MRFLLPFLTEVHFPLISARNKNPQRNDVPKRLEISHARNEKDHSLDDLYVENFSHTEYPVSYTHLIEVPPNPFWASIGLSVTPLPLGSGVQYESRVSLGYLNQSFQNRCV